MTLSQILSIVGGLGGFGSVIFLIVDWARKDERQIQQREKLQQLEKSLDEFYDRVMKELQTIERSLSRLEGRVDGGQR